MFNELKTKDDAWMQSIHERIDRLSAMIDGIFGDGAVPPKEDVYLCDSEVACMLKVSRRTLGEYRSNGTLPYYVLGGKVLYKRSEIEQVLEREYRSVGKARGSGWRFHLPVFYALVQAAGIKTVRIKAGRLRAPATDCFLEVREFAVWKKNLFLDFGTKSSPARYQTVIPVCNPFLTVLVTVCFNPAWPLFTFHKETVPPLWPGYETERLFLTVAKKEKSKVFCMFRKKSYLYIKWVAHQRNWCQVCRNQNGCQLVTSFFDDPHKLLFLADYVILSKIISILGIRLSEYRKFYVPAVLHPLPTIYNDMLSEHFPIKFLFFLWNYSLIQKK